MGKGLSAIEDRIKQYNSSLLAPSKNIYSHRNMTRFGEGGCHELTLEELIGKVFICHRMWYLELCNTVRVLSSSGSLMMVISSQ